jgi:hypothetical protein
MVIYQVTEEMLTSIRECTFITFLCECAKHFQYEGGSKIYLIFIDVTDIILVPMNQKQKIFHPFLQ